MSEPASPTPPTVHPVRPVWAVVAVGVAALLLWMLSDVLLLAFAGVLFALILRRLGRPLRRRGVSAPWALVLVLIGLVIVIGGGSWLTGAGAAEQMEALRETVPRAFLALRAWLAERSGGRWLLQLWESTKLGTDELERLAFVASGTFNGIVGAIGSVVLLVALGIYLAADPATYRRGFVRLLPPARRARTEGVLDAAGHDLSRWLLGQAVSMVAVGALTWIGLALVGAPLSFPLAVVAGVLEFVPYFGPIVSAVFIVAVALTEGEASALWALLVCFAVQQAEAFVVQPLAQRWAVQLPPVLAMLSVVIFGVLFGLPGVLLAVPLMVLTLTLVEHLWVRPLEAADPLAAAADAEAAGWAPTGAPQRKVRK